jgi:hypothetical protein
MYGSIHSRQLIINNLLNPNIMKTEWTTDELQEDFKVLGFSHGYCAVQRKSDGVKGSLDFDGRPRVYFNFKKA